MPRMEGDISHPWHQLLPFRNKWRRKILEPQWRIHYDRISRQDRSLVKIRPRVFLGGRSTRYWGSQRTCITGYENLPSNLVSPPWCTEGAQQSVIRFIRCIQKMLSTAFLHFSEIIVGTPVCLTQPTTTSLRWMFYSGSWGGLRDTSSPMPTNEGSSGLVGVSALMRRPGHARR